MSLSGQIGCGTNERVMRVLMAKRPSRRRTGVRTAGVAVMTAAALVAGLVPVSSADTGSNKQKLDAKIAQMSRAVEGTSADLAKAVLALQRTKVELPGAQKA